MPINTTLEFRFDRFLLPSTAVRQSFFIYSGDRSNFFPGVDDPVLVPRYDVVERVVSFELPPGLTFAPNTHYTLELVMPRDDADFGFRAFDGAPLAEHTPERLSFFTSRSRQAIVHEPSATCSDMVGRGRGGVFGFCSTSGCHASEGDGAPAVMGLDLGDADAVVRTAVNRVAHETEIGPRTGVPLENPPRFGTAMPRIDPGRPDNSYLMYKLVAAPENYALAGFDPEACVELYRDRASCVPPSDAELARLSEWLLRGSPMPRSPLEASGVPPAWIGYGRLRAVQSFIQAGAPCP